MLQESFQLANTFPEQRTRVKNYAASRKARCGHGNTAMQDARRKKGVSRSGCYV